MTAADKVNNDMNNTGARKVSGLLANFPPKAQGVCDACGGKLIRRPDDEEETIEERLKVYEKETSPLVDYYKKEKLLQEVPGDLDVQELGTHLNEIFKKKGLLDR